MTTQHRLNQLDPRPRPVPDGGGSRSVQASSTASVPGDGSNRRLLVGQEPRVRCGPRIRTLSRLRQDAFARFEVVNRHDFPLMAGPLRAFSGGEYLGKTNIDTVASGEKFKLYFGADKRIEVKYRQIKRKKSEGWWSKTVDFEWAIKFKNHSPEKVRINVIDAMPKLGNDELSLKSVKFSPKPVNDFEKDENRLVKWMIELDPGEEMEITVSF
ncbi:MAG: DUF4139 domain-containing protein [Planctomycetota bacterium]|nr:DUF4139 domain-containing protein [Planctomycetota bacterium]